VNGSHLSVFVPGVAVAKVEDVEMVPQEVVVKAAAPKTATPVTPVAPVAPVAPVVPVVLTALVVEVVMMVKQKRASEIIPVARLKKVLALMRA
jgi:hypothetical protein